METIYDVLAFIVSKLRHVASDAEIDQALSVIADWQQTAAKGSGSAKANA